MIDANRDGTASMVMAGLGPTLHDAREVVDVEGDHDTKFFGGEGQKVVVAPPVEETLLVGRAHVVATLAAKCCSDARSGDVGIEEESHFAVRSDECAVDGRKLCVEGLQRSTTISNDLIDLVGEP